MLSQERSSAGRACEWFVLCDFRQRRLENAFVGKTYTVSYRWLVLCEFRQRRLKNTSVSAHGWFALCEFRQRRLEYFDVRAHRQFVLSDFRQRRLKNTSDVRAYRWFVLCEFRQRRLKNTSQSLQNSRDHGLCNYVEIGAQFLQQNLLMVCARCI